LKMSDTIERAWNWWVAPGKAIWDPGWTLPNWHALLRGAVSAVLALLIYLLLRALGVNPPGLYLWILFPILAIQAGGAAIHRYRTGARRRAIIEGAVTGIGFVLVIAYLSWQYGWP
jgi:hypothetical protein